ncbi:MAG: glucose-1-phosphate thymidylyltransferase, partial [Bacteroidota bacterium]
DGFLGNSVIGEWGNIGADTNCSNLRNDYAEVKVWSYPEGRFVKSGKQFHGLILADHAKVGINTMFNTGSVVGFAANVFGEGFPRTFIPSFSWGGSSGYMTYRMDKALATANRMMQRRGKEVTEADAQMFAAVFEQSAQWRRGK